MNMSAKTRSAVWTGGVLAVVAALVVGVWSALGAGYADTRAQTSPLASNDVASVAAKTYLLDCAHHPVVRPRTYTLTCGDANEGLERIAWTSWGGVQATATARMVENTCTPYCAAGHYAHYRVKAVAHDLRRQDGNGIYRKITVTFAGKKPSWVHGRSTTFDVLFVQPPVG